MYLWVDVKTPLKKMEPVALGTTNREEARAEAKRKMAAMHLDLLSITDLADGNLKAVVERATVEDTAKPSHVRKKPVRRKAGALGRDTRSNPAPRKRAKTKG